MTTTFDETRPPGLGTGLHPIRRSYRRHVKRRKAFFAKLNKPERVSRRENAGLTLPAPLVTDGRRP